MFFLSEHIPEDSSKLEVLYYKFAHSLWYVAMAYVKDEQLAEDIVQDTFLKLTRCPERLGQIEASQTRYFLFTIVRHLSIDAIRRRQRRNERSHEEYMDVTVPNVQYLPLERLVMKETIEDIKRALDRMPDRYRTPLELRLVYGCSNKEIAEILDITPNLVGVQLVRARNMISKFLKEGLDESE